MKNHTLGISLISVLGVICAGLTTNAMAAGSIRSLGGAGTYNGTSAAATSTRTAPARAGSLRVTPSSARLITTTNNNSNTSATSVSGGNTNTSGTTQRLSVGKYLGAATTVSGGGTSAGSQTTPITTRLDKVEGDISDIQARMPHNSSDGIVLVDEESGEITIDPETLRAAMNITSGTNGEDGKTAEFNYNSTTHELRWKYSDEPDSAFSGDDRLLVDVDTLMGDYLTADDLAGAIADLGGFQPKSTADYQVGNASGGWTGLTTAQIAALDSGATTDKINQIATNTGNIATLSETVDALTGIEGFSSGLVTNDDLDTALADYATSDALSAKADKTTTYTKDEVGALLNGKQAALDANQLAAVNSGVNGTVVAQVTANTEAIAIQDGLISGKQNTITSTNKLSADLVDDTNSTNKFVTAAEKSTWDAKQDALTFDTAPTANSTNPVTSGGIYTAINAISGDVAAIDDQIDAALADYTTTSDLQSTYATKDALNAKADKSGVYPKDVSVPSSGKYVLGFLNGVQMYIPVVDTEDDERTPIVAEVTEEP